MGWFSRSDDKASAKNNTESFESVDNSSSLINEESNIQHDLNDSTVNTDLESEKEKEIQKKQQEYLEYTHTQRLGLPAYPRIGLTAVTAGGYGLMAGFYQGFKIGSLKYLALNAHRLPKKKGGWYFYHKRKNYVVLREALMTGFKTMAKYGTVSAAYMGLEAYFDHIRGQIDFLSTVGSAVILGSSYAFYSKYFILKNLSFFLNP